PQLQAPLGADADLVEQSGDAASATRAVKAQEAAEVVQKLLSSEVVVEIRILGKVAEPALDPEVAGRPAHDPRVAGGWKHQLQQKLQRGRLAGAVGAEEAEHLAGLDLKRQAIESAAGPLPPESDGVILRELGRLDRERHDSLFLCRRALHLEPDRRLEVLRR